VAEKHPDPTEEQITFLFSGELREAVERSSLAGQFAAAFQWDLLAHPPPMPAAIDPLSGRGLVGRVNFHHRQHEGRRSGSDLGVIVTRPSVSWVANSLRIQHDCRRALLAQAKLNKHKKSNDRPPPWGSLTKRQQAQIPQLRDFYALLLYTLGGAGRDRLERFRWQSCKDREVAEIQDWLISGVLPGELSSTDVIKGLFDGNLGTDASSTIDALVDPPSSYAGAIEIRIHWPDDQPRPDEIRLLRQPERQKVRITNLRQ
jgi:hypothetical protein